MKINGNTIKPGMVLQHNGGLWVVTKASHVKPGKGGAFANVEAKNLETGNKLNERFRSEDKVERVTLEQKDFSYLFDNGDSLVFMDDGVYELVKGQQTKGIGIKNFSPSYRALEGYDIEKLYVDQASLEQRGLTVANLLVPVEVLDKQGLGELMQQQDVILSF